MYVPPRHLIYLAPPTYLTLCSPIISRIDSSNSRTLTSKDFKTWMGALLMSLTPLISSVYNARRKDEALLLARVAVDVYFFLLMMLLLPNALPSLHQTTPRMSKQVLASCRDINELLRKRNYGEAVGENHLNIAHDLRNVEAAKNIREVMCAYFKWCQNTIDPLSFLGTLTPPPLTLQN